MKSVPDPRSEAIVIGAGLGGLSAAMRLGAKGYRVTVIDRLDRAGGRGSSITEAGHRFDLGPTIVTVPEVFRKLWAACGRDFDADVELRPLDPFYEIRWPDGSHFTARSDTAAMVEEVRRLSPRDVPGYLRFLKDSRRRYVVGYEGMVAEPMHRLWDTIKVLPEFARLRADRSILGHAKARVQGRAAADGAVVPSAVHRGRSDERHLDVRASSAISRRNTASITRSAACRRSPTPWRGSWKGRGVGCGLASRRTRSSSGTARRRACGWCRARCCGRRWSSRTRMRGIPTRGSCGTCRGSGGRTRRWAAGSGAWGFTSGTSGRKGTRGMWPDVGHHTILSGPRYEGLLRDIFIRGRWPTT